MGKAGAALGAAAFALGLSLSGGAVAAATPTSGVAGDNGATASSRAAPRNAHVRAVAAMRAGQPARKAPMSKVSAPKAPAAEAFARKAPGPAAAAGTTTGSASRTGDVVSGFMQIFRRGFANKAPTASPTQAMVRPGGQIWGFMAGSDPEGDPIRYSLKRGPKYGTVTIDQYGVYTYRPGTAFTGTDAFTVKVTDSAFHLLGKSAVLVTVTSAMADPAGTVVDDFTGEAGTQPNPSLWTTSTGMFVDSGIQTYSDSADNVRLDGQGHLVLQGRSTPDGYTSGEVTTRGKADMMYGALTARIKFPAGQGIWPAFWMLGSTYAHDTWDALGPTGWPGCGEIDIMELVNTGTTYHVALHGPQISDGGDYYGGPDSGRFVGTSGPIEDLTRDYHDYWVIRAPDLIVVGVDDTKLAAFTPDSLPTDGQWVFNQPMYAILNVAIGGAWPGLPDDTTTWPATMLVDSFKYTPLA